MLIQTTVHSNIKRKHLLVKALTIMLFFTTKVFAQTTLSKEAFKNPANDSKPLTWWHWINGNVTKEGIKKDLMDIKRVGIGGVQLFDTHMYLPKGPIRYGSDGWFDHVNYAMQLCDSLGLAFYITNSPGWSGAGGPWISVEKSMKQLVYSETNVSKSNATQLTNPFTKNGFYKDVAVMAVSATRDGEKAIKSALVNVHNAATNDELKNLTDNNEQTSVPFEKGKSNAMAIVFEFKSAVDVNSANISLSDIKTRFNFTGTVDVSTDGENYQQATGFSFVGHQASTGNFTIPFTTGKAKFLRLTIEDPKQTFNIDEIRLKNLYGLKDWASRIGMSKSPFLTTEVLMPGERQALSRDEVIDVSSFLDTKTGLLNWTPPPGNWTILRFGFTTTGKVIHPAVDEGTGYEVDKLDTAALSFQFNQSLGRIIRDAGSLTGKTFKGLLFDSFEGGYQNWTAMLPQLFADKNNYKIIPYLPMFTGRIIESKARTSAVLWDFQQTLTTLFAENYYGTMQKLANEHHLQTFSESQGGPMSPAHANAYVDVPMNEFWTDGIQLREKLIKQTVSIANILGKNIVGAEAFTSKPAFGKWQSTPESMKGIGDYAFTTGINRFIFHTYTHQPYEVVPGFTMGRYGTHFGRTNTWWEYASGWMDYIGRCQYLLQKGHMVADVCFLSSPDAVYEYPGETPSSPRGYNFDIIYPDYLKEITVTKGELKLATGPTYKLMVLPTYPFATIETLLSLQNLLKEGAVILGAPPVASPNEFSPEKQQHFEQLVKDIWGGLDGKSVLVKNYGKGKLYWGKSMEAVLEEIKLVPDFKHATKGNDSIRYIHKQLEDADIYFISNQSDTCVDFKASFRNQGKQPEIWHPESGEIWNVHVFDTLQNTINIPLNLTPKEALFVVFSKRLPTKWIENIDGGNIDLGAKLNRKQQIEFGKTHSIRLNFSDGSSEDKKLTENTPQLTIHGPWHLNFLNGRGAPSSYQMKDLKLWQDIDIRDIKYYSGAVSYKSQFHTRSIDPDEIALLELGELYDLAEVFVNDKSAGIIWKKPYQIDITSLLKKGNNSLKITVVNRWINRLIGDELIKTDLRYNVSNNIFTSGKLKALPEWLANTAVKRTDQRYTFTTWKHYNNGDPLVNSGLLAPIKITFHKQLNLAY